MRSPLARQVPAAAAPDLLKVFIEQQEYRTAEMFMAALDARPFGKSGVKVTSVGLGGEGVLRTSGRDAEAAAVIREALSQGITFFDSAKAYAGSEGYYGAVWSEDPDARGGIFQASKSARRDQAGAELDLADTLATMGIETLDLWQIHDIRSFSEIRRIEAPDGALNAFLEARDTGLVRFIGVSGHHDPDVLTHAVEVWPVDAVMMPANPVEAALSGGFLDTALPAAEALGIAVIGMKVLGAGYYIAPDAGISPDRLIRFALGQEIAVAIVGCSTPGHLRVLADAGREGALPPDEVEEVVDLFRPAARQLAYYRGAV